jgi:hypothetical protein
MIYRATLNSRALIGALTSSRYSELEKQIQRETDPDKKRALERDLLRVLRTGRS